MMGARQRHFPAFSENLSLEDLVPKDNFYRRLEEILDLSFARELVKDLYAPSGRPSVDPEVSSELRLVIFFEDNRGERLLMRVAAVRMLKEVVTQGKRQEQRIVEGNPGIEGYLGGSPHQTLRRICEHGVYRTVPMRRASLRATGPHRGVAARAR